MKAMRCGAVLLMICCLTTYALAVDYFVSRHGSDKATGRAETAAFATIGKGISVLKPGDTLIILPGEYFESVRARLCGKPGLPITIRAKRRGTVLMRGDVDAAGFELLPGTRYTYALDFEHEREVEGVGERDTFKVYAFVPSLPEVEDVRGSCWYDRESKRLYVHTSDSGHPDSHGLSVSVTNDFGILLESPRGEKTVHDVIIEGIACSGYQNREVATRPGGLTRWGMYIVLPERCTIRGCTAFLNGGGIGLVRPKDCLIEECTAFGNYSTFSASGGNIISWSPAKNTIHRNNVVHTTKSNGLRFYGGGTENCVQEGNLAYDCRMGEIWIKGGSNKTSRMMRNISLGMIYNSGGVPPDNIRHNICKYGSSISEDGSNIVFSKMRRFDPDRHFADPVHHDYRLQSDSPLRGTGPNGTDPGPFPYRDEVFFVGPNGDDNAAGTSVKQAWKTLKRAAASAGPGHTVYILPGTYAEPLVPARSGTSEKPIVFRRRGRGRVELNGGGRLPVGVDLHGLSHIAIEGLRVRGFTGVGISANRGEGIRIEKCTVLSCGQEGILALEVKDLAVCHCLVRDNAQWGLRLDKCTAAAATGNIFDVNEKAAFAVCPESLDTLWSDRNDFVPSADKSCVTIVADGGKRHSLARWQMLSKLDPNSLAVEARYRNANAGEFSLRDDSMLPGRGPLTTPIGPYERDAISVPLRIEGVRVHSVTATTANIEWWTPTTEATTTLEWGPTPACKSKIENIYDGSIFHTVSLCGLKPATKYYYRVSATAPTWEFHTNEDLAQVERAKPRELRRTDPVSFETLAKDPPRRTFHVAVTGDDKNDGVSADTGWRTLRHAAACVRAGDTVIVHRGTYEEHVPIRATGDAHAPITFRAAPGEKVWLDGSGQKRPTAIRVAFKQHVHLDGFYFHNFRSSRFQIPGHAGAVEVLGGAHNVIRRCFYDGRAKTYMPYFVRADSTRGMVVENCVIINGWNGSSFRECPDLAIRHCVFYNCLIQALSLFNSAEQPVTLSHNVLCDNIPQKHNNPLVSLWHLEALRADHNCYFVRKSPEERFVAGYVRIKGKKDPKKLVIAELRTLTGQEKGSIFANPGMRVVKALKLKYKSRAEHSELEMHRKGDDIRPLDFADFFADEAGPCGQAASTGSGRADRGKPIGLDREAFRKTTD